MKLFATLLLMLALAGAALTQESPVRSVGDGFLTKTRVLDETTEVVLIKFPDRCFQNGDVFKRCAEEVLALEPGCKALRCPVKVVPADGDGAEVARVGKGALRIYLINSEGSTVGIGYKRPRRQEVHI
jgi:hypothetical protein